MKRMGNKIKKVIKSYNSGALGYVLLLGGN